MLLKNPTGLWKNIKKTFVVPLILHDANNLWNTWENSICTVPLAAVSWWNVSQDSSPRLYDWEHPQTAFFRLSPTPVNYLFLPITFALSLFARRILLYYYLSAFLPQFNKLSSFLSHCLLNNVIVFNVWILNPLFLLFPVLSFLFHTLLLVFPGYILFFFRPFCISCFSNFTFTFFH